MALFHSGACRSMACVVIALTHIGLCLRVDEDTEVEEFENAQASAAEGMPPTGEMEHAAAKAEIIQASVSPNVEARKTTTKTGKGKAFAERDPQISRLEGPGGVSNYDRDGSGELNSLEFRSLLKDFDPITPAAVSDAEVDYLLKKYDKDDSQELSVIEVLKFARDNPPITLAHAIAEAECSGWAPSTGQDAGKGGSCAKWGFQTTWCYVAWDFGGVGAATKLDSLEYPGKSFAPCKIKPQPAEEEKQEEKEEETYMYNRTIGSEGAELEQAKKEALEAGKVMVAKAREADPEDAKAAMDSIAKESVQDQNVDAAQKTLAEAKQEMQKAEQKVKDDERAAAD